MHDDRKYFKTPVFEGDRAGLSWKTELQKREAYRKAFHGFDPEKVAGMTDEELENLLKNPVIIRNRLEVFAARTNALVFLFIQKESGCFDKHFLQFEKTVFRVE